VRLASILSPMMRMCSAFGPMKVMLCRFEDFREARILGQEAVAGMNGVGARDLAGGEQRGDVEIAVARGRRADADALVGEAHMHGIGVGGGMRRDGLMPSSLQARRMRRAISPRLAIRILSNIGTTALIR
jgi:hypothetical protein